ncbi:MAG: glutamine amidotransferase-related protein, partial [Tetragenococcus koreensis]
ICLGMQMACVEFARNVIGLKDANTTERDPKTPYNVIDLMTDQEGVEDMGGTLRLGLYPCKVQAGTKTAQAYQDEVVQERHRHRYEFNNEFREIFKGNGMSFSGVSPDNHLVE